MVVAQALLEYGVLAGFADAFYALRVHLGDLMARNPTVLLGGALAGLVLWKLVLRVK